jgi:predicted RNA-binding Zn ribbon-like protein
VQLAAWIASLKLDVDPSAFGPAAAERLRALRAVIRDLALAAIDGRPLDRRMVGELNAVAASAPTTSQLGVTKTGPRLQIAHAPATPPLDALLGDLARSAIALLADLTMVEEQLLTAPDGYALLYTRENGNRALDAVELDAAGLACRVHAYYLREQP